MNKIELIQQAISEANMFRSKLTPEALSVPGYTSLKIRHLMNNLGALSTNFCEVGSHKGGTLCSGIYQNVNLSEVTSIDNFSEFDDGKPMQELINNVGMFNPPTVKFNLIVRDCWDIPNPPKNVDFFMYDGEHSTESQRRAMTEFIPWLADECIFVIDDFSAWPFVKEATKQGIALAELRYRLKNAPGYKVLFEQELWDGNEGNNMGWHNGFWVGLLSKI